MMEAKVSALVTAAAVVGGAITSFSGEVAELRYPASPFVPKSVETYRPETTIDSTRIASGNKVLHFLNVGPDGLGRIPANAITNLIAARV